MDTRIKEVDELLERVTAIQEEIDKRAKAKRVMWYQQPGFPYWTNRVARIEIINDFGGGDVQYQISVEMRYHAGTFTEGADTDLEISIQQYIILALAIFKNRSGLESKKFPDEMNALEIDNIPVVSRGVGTIPIGTNKNAKGSVFDLTANITLSVGGL